MASCWTTWRAYVAWKRGLKAAALAVVHKMQHKGLLAAWNSWLEFMYLRQAKRKAVAKWLLG